MTIKLIWTLKVAPRDEPKDLHELGLSWYRFEEEIEHFGKLLRQSARPAVWIKFSQIEQLERIQGAFPEAKLGPATSFTEALIFADNLEKGEEIRKKVVRLLTTESEVDAMEAILREDTMEDY